MCTIIAKGNLVGKNFDSIVKTGMIYTNKRGQIKSAAVFPPERALEWVSVYGSLTFSQCGKEFPVGGINESGLVVEQATLRSSGYPESGGKPIASSLEVTQYLLDTCKSVEQALAALDRIAISVSSWPIHFALFDSGENRAVVEYLNGEKKVYQGYPDQAIVIDNTEYQVQQCKLELKSEGDLFEHLSELKAKDTVWSNGYDLRERKLLLNIRPNSSAAELSLNDFDFSMRSENRMLDITGHIMDSKASQKEMTAYQEDANQKLSEAFYCNPIILELMKLPDPKGISDFVSRRPKSYDTTNEIVLRFLEGEQIRQLPVKEAHKLPVLKYLASRFEIGMEYTEAQVNAIIDDWHTFGDYFVLRRELIDNGLLKRLPNGSKYWRE